MLNNYIVTEKNINENLDKNDRNYFFETPINDSINEFNDDYFINNKIVNCENNSVLPSRCNILKIDPNFYSLNSEPLIDPFYKYSKHDSNYKIIYPDDVMSKFSRLNDDHIQITLQRINESVF